MHTDERSDYLETLDVIWEQPLRLIHPRSNSGAGVVSVVFKLYDDTEINTDHIPYSN